MMFPNYQRVDERRARTRWFENFWGTKLDDKPGYTVVEIMHKALAPDSDPHKIRGMYIMGENPAMSDPDLNHARHALRRARASGGAGHLHDRDRLAGRRGAAGQRLAREDRHRDQHRPHGAARPPRARPAGRCASPTSGSSSRSRAASACRGTTQGEECGVAAVYEEMRQAMHEAIGGITWERLERESSVTYPCLTRGRSRPADRVHRQLPDRRTAA